MATPVIVTGAAGFIGMHVAERLLDRGEAVIGVDVFNAYYDPALKDARAARLDGREGFTMIRMDIAEHEAFAALVKTSGAKRVIHLAAQAGVRYSIENPFAYERSNLAGHLSVLEACRHAGVEHLVYASSSSVYGDRPLNGDGFRETDPANAPVSLYAATKRSCEMLSQSYAALYGFPQSGLRFFTVYGPWGRPDMAIFKFTRAIVEGNPIPLFNHGRLRRDFTYVADVAGAMARILDLVPKAAAGEAARAKIYNVGNNRPEELLHVVNLLETELGRTAKKELLPMQPGDMFETFADIDELTRDTGFTPRTSIEDGIRDFVAWYRQHYKV